MIRSSEQCSDGLARQPTAAPASLKVETAGHPVHIKQFTRQVETGAAAALHRGQVDLPQGDTAGGVALGDVNLATMESRRCPGLYLAGELLDVDGVTGGFNFQACWSGGWLAGQAIAAVLT